MGVEWIEYKSKKIFYADYSNIDNDDELLRTLSKAIEIIKNSSGSILGLSNFRNTHVGSKFMDEANKAGKEIFANKFAKQAFIGITGIQKILLNSYIAFTGQKNVQSFDDEEQAKEWLVS